MIGINVGLAIGSILWAAMSSDPRRDVGRVEDPIGSGYTKILPRAELYEPGTGLIASPDGTPVVVAPGRSTELALGPGVGAQVPYNEPNYGLPGAVYEPLPPDARDPRRRSIVPSSPPVVNAPAPNVGIPAYPTIPPVAQPMMISPSVMTYPSPGVVPVVFPTATTGSSFIPAGGSPLVNPQPSVSARPPGVVPSSTLTPPAMGEFLSELASPPGLQLQPKAPPASTAAPASASAVAPQSRPAASPPPRNTTPPPAASNSPASKPAPPPTTSPKPSEDTFFDPLKSLDPKPAKASPDATPSKPAAPAATPPAKPNPTKTAPDKLEFPELELNFDPKASGGVTPPAPPAPK